MTTLVARAHAKINLSLRIVGVRPDGYHDLRTVFQAIALHDTLTFRRRRGPFALRSSAPGLPLDERNLVCRAAALVWRELGRSGEPRDVAVSLTKRIPVQAGLGGGSSDAAAALVALSRLWRMPGGLARARAIAEELGADVAFFTIGGTAVGAGRGELIFPVDDFAGRPVVLLVPSFGVSTTAAYAWYDADRPAGEPFEPQPLPPRFTDLWPLGQVEPANDLQPAVARRHPEIAEMAAALRGAGANVALMSGSGSTVFGVFDSTRPARRAAARLGRGRWRAFLTHTLGRADYASRARPTERAP